MHMKNIICMIARDFRFTMIGTQGTAQCQHTEHPCRNTAHTPDEPLCAILQVRGKIEGRFVAYSTPDRT